MSFVVEFLIHKLTCKLMLVTGAARFAVAFGMMAFSCALWTVIQHYAQIVCGVNHLGFLALDQVAAAPYILLYTAVVSLSPFDRLLLWAPDRMSKETLRESIAHAWRQSSRNHGKGVLLLLASKMLTTLTVAGGFLLVVTFNPATVVLQMSVMRLLMSWVCTVVVIGLFPDFLRISDEEKASEFSVENLLLKLSGSAILICLLCVVSQKG